MTPVLDVKFNKANKEATMGYLTSWKEQFVEDIAAERGLTPQEVSLFCTCCYLLYVCCAAKQHRMCHQGCSRAVQQSMLCCADSQPTSAAIL